MRKRPSPRRRPVRKASLVAADARLARQLAQDELQVRHYVHQCKRCDNRYETEKELKAHLKSSHSKIARSPVRTRSRSVARVENEKELKTHREPGYSMTAKTLVRTKSSSVPRSPSTDPLSPDKSPEKVVDGKNRCPRLNCGASGLNTPAKQSGHQRSAHEDDGRLTLDQEKELCIEWCPHCTNYYANLSNHKCKTKDNDTQRYNTPEPTVWYMYDPGTKNKGQTWALIPLIHHTLGLIKHGGMTQMLAGDRWTKCRPSSSCLCGRRI